MGEHASGVSGDADHRRRMRTQSLDVLSIPAHAVPQSKHQLSGLSVVRLIIIKGNAFKLDMYNN